MISQRPVGWCGWEILDNQILQFPQYSQVFIFRILPIHVIYVVSCQNNCVYLQVMCILGFVRLKFIPDDSERYAEAYVPQSRVECRSLQPSPSNRPFEWICLWRSAFYNLGCCTRIFLLELSLQQTGIEHRASEPGRYWKSTWISVNWSTLRSFALDLEEYLMGRDFPRLFLGLGGRVTIHAAPSGSDESAHWGSR